MEIRQVSVIGSGTMGRGIAYVCALAGYLTVLNDIEQSYLDTAREQIEQWFARGIEKGKLTEPDASAARERLRYEPSLEPAVAEADLIIEAIPEDLTLKKDLLSQADVFCGDHTLLASNTSSLSISELAGAVERRDQFIGLHFFNPVPVMQLLEIVVGERTSRETIEQARTFAARLGKEAIVVRDSPGFATSRLGIALGLEAIRMLEEEVGSAEDIDRAMELGYNHPMGPLRLTDLVGLDVRLRIAEYLASKLGDRFEPPALLRRMVEEGKLGKKSGKGFYDWTGR
ncbi:MAG TPA: 3-hydroxyacyl-CoA dehydrogenase family protein [Thermoanaerobaculia bacterium]|nr:3-hydroxyacyl-CoA dehydrogenase family protein [Thermoanaerobaculia bacterium]